MNRRPSQWVFDRIDGNLKMNRLTFYAGLDGKSHIYDIEVRDLRWYEKFILWIDKLLGKKPSEE